VPIFPAAENKHLVETLAPSEPTTEENQLYGWIEQQLVEGGFPLDMAAQLSVVPYVDYREAIRLLELSGSPDWTLDQLT